MQANVHFQIKRKNAMSREDWACFFIIVLGIILFLVGANLYNAFVGWLGVFLFLGGIIALVALYMYNWLLTKKPSQQQLQAQNP